MDYESETECVGSNGYPFTTITGGDDTIRAPSLFREHGAADTLTALYTSPDLASTAEVITNPLDEQQQQHQVAREERAKRRSEILLHLAEQDTMSFMHPQMRSASEGNWPIPIGMVRWARDHDP